MKKNFLVFILFFMIIGTGDFYANDDYQVDPTLKMQRYDDLFDKACHEGSVKVFVKIDVPNIKKLTEDSTNFKVITPSENGLPTIFDADIRLKESISAIAQNVLCKLEGTIYKLRYKYFSIPYISLEVSPQAIGILMNLPEVLNIEEIPKLKIKSPTPDINKQMESNHFLSSQSVSSRNSLIGADKAWEMGFSGKNWYIAILDSGVITNNVWFQGKQIIILECNEGEPCSIKETHYTAGDHGTTVAQRALGYNKSSGEKGVAYESDLISCLVYSSTYGDPKQTDQLIKTLEWLYNNRYRYPIAAINHSAGYLKGFGEAFDETDCNQAYKFEPLFDSIQNLYDVNIPTVFSSGNDYECDGTVFPGCIKPAITISATVDYIKEQNTDSNWHPTIVDFFAPGAHGTSYAAPMVAGAWTLLRSAADEYNKNFEPSDYHNAFRTSADIVKLRCSDYDKKLFIRVDNAIFELLINFELTSPLGTSEDWTHGSIKEISWNSVELGNVKLELWKDCHKGECFLVGTIVNSTENDGSFLWTVGECEGYTAEPGSHYYLKISLVEYPSKSSLSYPFTISEPKPKPTITVTSPIGGEKWIINNTGQIRWSATPDNTGNVKIDLLRSGAFPETIVDNSNNIPVTRGYYDWVVGDNITTPLQCRNDYQIRISSISDPSISDVSDSNFTITALETIDVDPGNDMKGKTYFKYGILPIKWNSTACAGATWKVRVYLCRPNTTIATIGDFDRSVTSYNYTIPNSITPASDYFIKARKVNPDDHSVYDISEKFSIKYNSISVTSPVTNRTYDRSKSKILPIRWTWQEDPKGGNVRIYLCKAYTTEFRVVATVKYDKGFNNGLNGKFDYTIPDDVVHAKYWVKVKWLTNGYVYGKTGNFIIK